MNQEVAYIGFREGVCLKGRALTHTQVEVVEGMLVDDLQLSSQSHCEFHHGAQMATAALSILTEGQPAGQTSEGLERFFIESTPRRAKRILILPVGHPVPRWHLSL